MFAIKFKTTLIFFCIFTLYGCSSIPSFSNDRTVLTRNTAKWLKNSIEKIQFYTSNNIVLERVVSNNDTSAIRGKLIRRSGRLIDRIIINAGTPGVFDYASDYMKEIDIDFGNGILEFGYVTNVGKGYQKQSIYRGSGGVYFLSSCKDGTLSESIGGKSYRIINPPSCTSILEIDANRVHKEKSKEKTWDGKRLKF